MEHATRENKLSHEKCKPCEGGLPPMADEEIRGKLRELDLWDYKDGYIEKSFKFKDFCENMAFVNSVAWISSSEGHHPDMHVSYDTCTIRYSTHSIGGLSKNDFICAARVDLLPK